MIINVATVNAKMPAAEAPSYSASKAALVNLTKSIATQYATKVRAITVSPGLTATPMWLGPEGVAEKLAATGGGTAEEIAAATAASTLLQRFLEPAELANCICFLASPRASGVTGTELIVDGGLTPTI